MPPASTSEPPSITWRCPQSVVRSRCATSEDLQALADWLKACGVTTVAMEATGVYWIPLFQLMEESGFSYP